MSSRQAEKEKARAARLAREQAEASHHRRRRQLWILAGICGLAVLVVAIAIAISSGSGTNNADNNKAPTGIAEVAKRFQGIPADGTSLGDPKAPVTLVEFADLKCPVCRQYADSAFPTLVDRYVRTGKLRMETKLQTFVGENLNPGDSPRAARYALAAAKQNKFWPFMDLFYLNQKDESTRYVTDTFLRRISLGVPGLSVAKAMSARNSSNISKQIQQSQNQFSQNGFSGTPSFLVGRTGGQLTPLNYSSFDTSQFTGPIDKLLNQ